MEGYSAMRRKIIALSLGLLLVAVFSAALFAQSNPRGNPAEKKPIAVIGEKTINLGEVLEGQDYNHSFVIRNTGAAELQILSVKPG